jgi:CRISPR/Cas system-associated protein Cas10 (large subunit of type III CRISPR-Cas system)
MSNIIDIEGRIKLEQKKKAKVDRAKKMEAVRKIVQCTRCLARCAKCGVQFETHEIYKRQKGPYRFCPFCQEEYEDFLRITEESEDSPFYWHNKEWVALWQSWLDFQQAMKVYGESQEFIDLVREVEWDR